MAAHSSILAWRTPWTEEPGRLQSMGSKDLDITEQLTCTQCIGLNFVTGVVGILSLDL